MANIQKRVLKGKISWRARYRTPSGAERSKSFDRKVDAERFLTTIESSKIMGCYVDPIQSKLAVGEWAERWLTHQAHLKPSTYERYTGILRQHILPKWESAELGKMAHSDIQSWVMAVSLRHSPATVRKIHSVLALVLDMSVKDGRLSKNVARGVNLPRIDREERRYLTHAQVEALATKCGKPLVVSRHWRLSERENETYRLIVLFLVYTGVRFGEMAALRVGSLDLDRRRARIVASVTAVQGRGLVWGTPKTYERREVPIPAFLVTELAQQVNRLSDDDLVFAGVRSAGPMRVATFRRGGFNSAAKAIGIPDLHPHELRHTAASLAIAAGADVKVVQQMLGHASAAMTMDIYGHLFDDRLDEVAAAMDDARTASQRPESESPALVLPQQGR